MLRPKPCSSVALRSIPVRRDCASPSAVSTDRTKVNASSALPLKSGSSPDCAMIGTNSRTIASSSLESMRAQSERVSSEAAKLVNALRNAPKARGRWGERALQNVLEQCGLSQHTDFHLERSIDTEDGRLRPDAIINVPGQKKLVIDAKVSLNAYQEAFEADTDEARTKALDAHAKSMRNHVQQLSAKSYQSQFEDTPDYVVMFVPGEHFVAAALEHDPQLWDFAFEKRVLLATPTNLVAIARTVAQVWRQDALAQEAKAIGRLASEPG